MYADSEIEQSKRLGACAKEPETVEFIEAMEKGSVLYDIGANVGSYSLIAASRGVAVLAFEPVYFNFARLCENVALNELKVFCLPLLLTESTQPVELVLSAREPGTALHEVGPGGFPTLGWKLDDLIAIAALPLPDYLKVDTDGHELKVLMGARRALHTAKAVQVELDTSKDAENVSAFLRGQGYLLETLTPHGDTPISNALFCRR